MAKQCVFCGDKAGSREHVLPAWLAREVSKEFVEAGGTRGLISKGRMVLIPGRFATATVKCVCRNCNNGWMSRLEAQVKPFLLDLMRGNRVTLAPVEQTALAAWSMKTMMMNLRASYLDEPHPIPKSDYTQLYEHGQPSMRRTVARAFLVEPPGDEHSHLWGDLEVRRFRARYNGYYAKLRTGAFAVQIVSAVLPPAHEVARFGQTSQALPLWPVQGERFDGPPPAPLPYEEWNSLKLQTLPVKKRQ
jgi:hypothetical protein